MSSTPKSYRVALPAARGDREARQFFLMRECFPPNKGQLLRVLEMLLVGGAAPVLDHGIGTQADRFDRAEKQDQETVRAGAAATASNPP